MSKSYFFFVFLFFFNFHFSKDSPREEGNSFSVLPIKIVSSSFSFPMLNTSMVVVGAEGGMHPALQQVARHNICLWKIPAVVPAEESVDFFHSTPFFFLSLSLSAFPCFPFIALDVARKLFHKTLDRSPKSFFLVSLFFFLTISPTPFEGRNIHVSRAVDSLLKSENMCRMGAVQWPKDPTLVAAEVLNRKRKCAGWRWRFLPETRENSRSGSKCWQSLEGRKIKWGNILSPQKYEKYKTKMFGETAEKNDVVGIYQGVTVLATPFKVPVEGKNSGKTTKPVWVFFFSYSSSSERWDIKIIRVVTHRTL